MKRVLAALIRFYQKQISPRRPPACRFVPTCSQYALEALELHGFWKGSALAIRRILRCNPFGKTGYDPVPPPKPRRRRAPRGGRDSDGSRPKP